MKLKWRMFSNPNFLISIWCRQRCDKMPLSDTTNLAAANKKKDKVQNQTSRETCLLLDAVLEIRNVGNVVDDIRKNIEGGVVLKKYLEQLQIIKEATEHIHSQVQKQVPKISKMPHIL